ncbi:MAG: AAA family ATPase [Ilumatobacter sp.]|uniref:AAA family ATPase n=1 Tax=Ilumatobacter sp. TaxID=1967498 RepID=UPI003919AB8E
MNDQESDQRHISPLHRDGPLRVVLTGGPGGGKTTAADLFRREIGDRVIVVPEAATLLFSGGFPRPEEPAAARSAQSAIYHVQRNLEDVQAARYPDRILLCDRGTVDGGAYWPGGPDEFFASVGSSHEEELSRYDAVIFFESAACGGHGFESENRFRTESQQQAVDLDGHLRALWAPHPSFTLISHSTSFFRKMTVGVGILENLVAVTG